MDADQVGEWLHEALVECYRLEDDAWPAAMVHQAMSRLLRVLPRGSDFTIEVLFLGQLTAFTAPGRYIYVSRRVLERPLPEDALALLLAHEIAHHQLGHLDLSRGWLQQLPQGAPRVVIAMLYRHLQHRVYGLDGEMAADARGLDLCLEAGYAGGLCLRLFDVLEADALDRGDIAGALGPDVQINPEVSESLPAKAAAWAWERLRGYPSLRKRKALLQRRLAARGD